MGFLIPYLVGKTRRASLLFRRTCILSHFVWRSTGTSTDALYWIPGEAGSNWISKPDHKCSERALVVSRCLKQRPTRLSAVSSTNKKKYVLPTTNTLCQHQPHLCLPFAPTWLKAWLSFSPNSLSRRRGWVSQFSLTWTLNLERVMVYHLMLNQEREMREPYQKCAAGSHIEWLHLLKEGEKSTRLRMIQKRVGKIDHKLEGKESVANG